jgi:hypothetical protein
METTVYSRQTFTYPSATSGRVLITIPLITLAAGLERKHLPIAEPERPVYTELKARTVSPPA